MSEHNDREQQWLHQLRQADAGPNARYVNELEETLVKRAKGVRRWRFLHQLRPMLSGGILVTALALTLWVAPIEWQSFFTTNGSTGAPGDEHNQTDGYTSDNEDELVEVDHVEHEHGVNMVQKTKEHSGDSEADIPDQREDDTQDEMVGTAYEALAEADRTVGEIIYVEDLADYSYEHTEGWLVFSMPDFNQDDHDSSSTSNVSIDYIALNSEGEWEWVYGGGYVNSTREQQSFVSEYVPAPNTDSQFYRENAPFPLLYGEVLNEDVERIEIYSQHEGTSHIIETMPVHTSSGYSVWFVVVEEGSQHVQVNGTSSDRPRTVYETHHWSQNDGMWKVDVE